MALPLEAQVDPIKFALVRRITNGVTLPELENADALMFTDIIRAQLPPYNGFDGNGLPDQEAFIANANGSQGQWPLVRQTSQLIFQSYSQNSTLQQIPRQQMREARIWRNVESKRGLYELLTDFWFNHFNIDDGKRAGYCLVPYFDETVCRRDTLGTFRDLLYGSAGVSNAGACAMLMYLDQIDSICGPGMQPNENYPREVMELHTLGADGGYDQQDVLNLSRMMSGWDMVRVAANRRFGTFDFVAANHCPQGYSFLGQTITADASGPGEGIQALDAMVDYEEPMTQIKGCHRFIATKLVQALLTDAVPVPGSAKEAVVNGAIADATAAFGVDGNILAMIGAILTEDNLRGILEVTAQSPEPPLYKHLTPKRFISNALIAVDANLNIPSTSNPDNGVASIVDELTLLGMQSYSFPPPIGYSEAIDVWVHNQVGRWNFLERLLRRRPGTTPPEFGVINGVTVDVPALYMQSSLGGFNRPTCAQQANMILTGGTMSTTDVTILQRYADFSPDGDLDVMWKILMLAMCCPSFNTF